MNLQEYLNCSDYSICADKFTKEELSSLISELKELKMYDLGGKKSELITLLSKLDNECFKDFFYYVIDNQYDCIPSNTNIDKSNNDIINGIFGNEIFISRLDYIENDMREIRKKDNF